MLQRGSFEECIDGFAGFFGLLASDFDGPGIDVGGMFEAFAVDIEKMRMPRLEFNDPVPGVRELEIGFVCGGEITKNKYLNTSSTCLSL